MPLVSLDIPAYVLYSAYKRMQHMIEQRDANSPSEVSDMPFCRASIVHGTAQRQDPAVQTTTEELEIQG
jgi:hypothetical protein